VLLKLAVGAIRGIIAGIPTGIAPRAAMRMVADGVPDPIRQLPTFTAEGTTAIIVAVALAGAPIGACSPWRMMRFQDRTVRAVSSLASPCLSPSARCSLRARGMNS